MPPIELGPVRPIGAVDARALGASARSAAAPDGKPVRAEKPAAEVALSEAFDPGQPPVDTNRVAEIRKAIEQGTYPVLPTRVADSIIAAGMLLRIAK